MAQSLRVSGISCQPPAASLFPGIFGRDLASAAVVVALISESASRGARVRMGVEEALQRGRPLVAVRLGASVRGSSILDRLLDGFVLVDATRRPLLDAIPDLVAAVRRALRGDELPDGTPRSPAVRAAAAHLDHVAGKLGRSRMGSAGIAEFLQTALTYGGDVYNDAHVADCGRIYFHAARQLVGVLPVPDSVWLGRLRSPDRLAAALLHPLVEVLGTITDTNGNAAAWALRHSFDAISASASSVTSPVQLVARSIAVAHHQAAGEPEENRALLLYFTVRAGVGLLGSGAAEGAGDAGTAQLLLDRLSPVLLAHPSFDSGDVPRLCRRLEGVCGRIVALLGRDRPTAAGWRPPANAYDVFISYRLEGGGDVARSLKMGLEQRGLRVFLDIDELRSGRFDGSLPRAIESTPALLVILSPGALDRCRDADDRLRREVEHAIGTGRKLIPVIMPGFRFPPDDALPEPIREFSKFHGIRFSSQSYPTTIERIADFVRGENV